MVSTTGQGDFPLNGRAFWKSLLLKRLSADFLNGVNYTQFGLGDSSYPKYVQVCFICTRAASFKDQTNHGNVGSIGLHASYTNVSLSLAQMKYIQAEKLTSNTQKGECVLIILTFVG